LTPEFKLCQQQSSANRLEKDDYLDGFLSILITCVLSLTIYLLISNSLLVVLKFHEHLSGQNPFANYTRSQELSENHIKFYDCSRNILTPEECFHVNAYYNQCFNFFKFLFRDKRRFFMFHRVAHFEVNTNVFVR
jgi:hypothetical protein